MCVSFAKEKHQWIFVIFKHKKTFFIKRRGVRTNVDNAKYTFLLSFCVFLSMCFYVPTVTNFRENEVDRKDIFFSSRSVSFDVQGNIYQEPVS